jgi:uncharacterized Zn finger protein (UPF0148 family)
MAYQACNECGNPIRECGGALCRTCTRFYETRPDDKKTAARRAELLLRLMRQRPEKPNPQYPEHKPVNIPQVVIATAAASAIAAAWGVRQRKGR